LRLTIPQAAVAEAGVRPVWRLQAAMAVVVRCMAPAAAAAVQVQTDSTLVKAAQVQTALSSSIRGKVKTYADFWVLVQAGVSYFTHKLWH